MKTKALSFFLILILLLGICPAAVFAAGTGDLIDYSDMKDWPAGPELGCEGAILVEVNSGSVLYAKNAAEKFYPASITKIMTALVVLEHAELYEKVTFSKEAIHDLEEGAFSYMADTGDELTVKDCLYAMLLMSSNEAAYALAEHVGRSLPGSAYLMNKKAEELGLVNTHFANPHGLFNEDHYTCPQDMAVIMKAALENDTFLEIAGTYDYTTAPTKTQPEGYLCRTTHPMRLLGNEYYDSRVVTGKTGYTSASQYTLTTYAKSGELDLICVVMKGESRAVTCADTAKLFAFGFNNFSFQPISSEADLAALEDVIQEELGRVVQNIQFSNDARALLPFKSTDVEIEDEFSVDVSTLKGNTVEGTVTYYYDDHELGKDSVHITLIPEDKKDTSSGSFLERLIEMAKKDKLLMTGLVLVGCLLLVLVLLAVVALISRRQRKRSGKDS